MRLGKEGVEYGVLREIQESPAVNEGEGTHQHVKLSFRANSLPDT